MGLLFLFFVDYSSAVDSTAFDLSNLTEGVRAYDLEQLKLNSVKCLTDSLFKKLLDLEEVGVSIMLITSSF